MRQIDLVLMMLPQLTDKEKQLVAQELQIHMDPCKTLGHKYRKGDKVIGWFFPKTRWVCERCGDKIWV